MRQRLAGVCGLWLVLAPVVGAAGLPPPPEHPHGQALWQVVHDQCLADMQAKRDPAPCAAVRPGYVLLKDRTGVAQYLLLPDEKITGIEDVRVLGSTNYFALAWDWRALVGEALHRPVARTGLAVTVNSPYGRSQDLLHLHIDCLSAAARRDLTAAAIGPDWSKQTVSVAGHPYYVRRLRGEKLADNPFSLLADGLGARGEMGAWTLGLVGAEIGDQPGFYLLAGRADPDAGEYGSAETIQDHACSVQTPGEARPN